MDDQRPPVPVAPTADHAAHAAPAPDEVAAVLTAVEGLDDRPLGEHVAVFEQAHESLRRVLAGGGRG